MGMTLGELMAYAVERSANDSFRQSVVEMELKRRAASAPYKVAIVSAVVGAVVGAVLTVALGHWL